MSPDPVADDWARFRALTTMTNHWDRPGWSPGRQSLHWFLTFEGAGDLHALTVTCQKQLRVPCLDPVPVERLHLTIGRLAFTDEITRAGIDDAVAEAARRCSAAEAFVLRIGPLAGSEGALRFTVAPWEPLLRLRTIVDDAAAAGQHALAAPDDFRPHVGIAYCNTTVSTDAIVDRVDALRDLPRIDVEVDALHLVRLRRGSATYLWDTVATLPLGRLTPAPAPGPAEAGRIST